MRIVIVCLGVLFSISSGAMALPVTFDFSSNSGILQFSSSGLSLDVSADSLDGAVSVGGDVTWYSDWGLGVDAFEKNDGKTLDSSGSDDLLNFEFGAEVRLEELVFSRVGPKDELRLLVDGMTLFDDEIDATLATSSNIVACDFSSLDLLGRNFSLMAIDSDDSFRVKSITVDYNQQPVPTPEPATWLLLSTGLAGLVYWRRRY